MLIENITMFSAIAGENLFGGTRERKKLNSCTSNESFCHSYGLFLSDSWNSVKRLQVDQRHVYISTGPLRWLTRLRFTAGLAKVRVTVVCIRAGGTSVGRLPCAFDLCTQLTRSRYNEKRTDPMVRPSNEIRGGAGREKQYGRITFLPRRKESTATAWSIAHQ